MTLGNVKPQSSGISVYESEVYQEQKKNREEIDEWIDILIESRFNPTLAELVKELQTMYEMTRGPKKESTEITGSWAGIILG